MKTTWLAISVTVVMALGAAACGNPADRAGIGAQCAVEADCPRLGDTQLKCLTGFKGGYCGLQGCATDTDCVPGSACVKVSGANYCFRECVDKPECNVNRAVEHESNCVGNAEHVGASTAKVCVPPSA